MVRWSDISGLGAGSIAAASRPEALATLLGVTARLYSYPEVSWIVRFLSSSCLDELRDNVEDALIADHDLDDALATLGAMTLSPVGYRSITSGGGGVLGASHDSGALTRQEILAHDFRIAFSKLHVSPPIAVQLELSWWMRRHVAGGGANLRPTRMNPDERSAVAREYRALGLRIRKGLGTPPDYVSNELDYLAYVTRMEADASQEGDLQSAGEWASLAASFARQHFHDPAIALAQATLERTDDPLLRLSATLVRALARACVHGRRVDDGVSDDW